MADDHICTYCKSPDNTDLYHTHDIFDNLYRLKECTSCKAVFLTPKPGPELLAKAYDDSYYGEGDEKFSKSYIEQVLDYFRHKRAKLIPRYAADGPVLDIGCGNGRYLSFVKELGNYEIHGIEMPGGSADRAAKIPGMCLKLGALRPDDYAPNTFSAVTLFHVFEHLTEPKETLDSIHRILKPEGILIMSFPNIGSWQSRMFKGKWLHLDPPRHIFFFKTRDFKRVMKELGFELIRERHFHIEYNPFGMSQSLLNSLLKKREVLYESLKGNQAYSSSYSRFSLSCQGWFYKLSMPLFIFTDFVASLFKKGATVEFVYRKK